MPTKKISVSEREKSSRSPGEDNIRDFDNDWASNRVIVGDFGVGAGENDIALSIDALRNGGLKVTIVCPPDFSKYVPCKREEGGIDGSIAIRIYGLRRKLDYASSLDLELVFNDLKLQDGERHEGKARVIAGALDDQLASKREHLGWSERGIERLRKGCIPADGTNESRMASLDGENGGSGREKWLLLNAGSRTCNCNDSC